MSIIVSEKNLIEKKQKRTPKHIKKAFQLYCKEIEPTLTISDFVDKTKLEKKIKEDFEKKYNCTIGLFSAIKIINNLF